MGKGHGCLKGCIISFLTVVFGLPIASIVLILICSLVMSQITKCCCSSGPDDDRDKVSDVLRTTKMPRDYQSSEPGLIPYYRDGRESFGSQKMMVTPMPDGMGTSLCVFKGDCTIADLCWLMTMIYNQEISPKITSGDDLTRADIALIDLAIRAHLAHVHAATASFWYGFCSDTMFVKGQAGSYYLHCTGDGLFADDAVIDAINTMCLNWYSSETGRAAKAVGESFKGCNRDWMLWLFGSVIRKEERPDIRWPNLQRDTRGLRSQWFDPPLPQLASFDFGKANAFSAYWKATQTSVYNESIATVQRINKEITVALSKTHDVSGYPELHSLIEKWRPVMITRVADYCVTYSDLPLTVLSKVAYDQTAPAEGAFRNDRAKILTIAHQFTRAISDGAMYAYTASATSASLALQYYGNLRRLLGSNDYQTFENSIKLRKPDPLKVEAK